MRITIIVVTDDDIAGTSPFRAPWLTTTTRAAWTAEQIGHAWLNYVVAERSLFWWGGTEAHGSITPYMRLKFLASRAA